MPSVAKINMQINKTMTVTFATFTAAVCTADPGAVLFQMFNRGVATIRRSIRYRKERCEFFALNY